MPNIGKVTQPIVARAVLTLYLAARKAGKVKAVRVGQSVFLAYYDLLPAEARFTPVRAPEPALAQWSTLIIFDPTLEDDAIEVDLDPAPAVPVVAPDVVPAAS